MNTFSTLLTCLGLVCTSPLALAQREWAMPVHVAAGNLADAVESLGKQTRVNVLYPGDLLAGRTTAGVEGTLPPREAFARLLQGSPLAVTEERGALRIAQAATSSTPVAPASEPAVPPANWTEQEIRISCNNCDWTAAMTKILERLGASDISVKPQVARFLSLAPAGKSDGEIESQLGMAARWQSVELELASLTPKRMSAGGRAAWGDTVRNRVLPLFTTRNVGQAPGVVTVDVLVPEPSSALSECHRVVQNGRIQRFCGRPDQWEDLQARVGFSCRDESARATGSRILRVEERKELCASADEWRRVAQARAMQALRTPNFDTGEATQSAAQMHPTPMFMGPTVGAPVTPAPAPAK